jgi:hypothetical protein
LAAKRGKKVYDRKPGEPYIRADGQPHASSGSGPRPETLKALTREQINPHLLPSVPADGNDPSAELLAKMRRTPSFDPADPSSMFYDVGRKLTAEKKVEYLKHLATYGRVGLAAHYVGVTDGTVTQHRKKDPLFDELCTVAANCYREACVGLITQQALMGITEYRWDKEGNILSVRRTFETRLRELILKHADPAYNETQKQEVTVQGGTVFVPPPAENVADWPAMVAAMADSGSMPALSAGVTVETTGVPSVGTEALEPESGDDRIASLTPEVFGGSSDSTEPESDDSEPESDRG